MKKVFLNEETKKNILEDLLKRSPNSYSEYEKTVDDIINDVRDNKDEAIFKYTLKFDGFDLNKDNIRVTEEEFKEAFDLVDDELIDDEDAPKPIGSEPSAESIDLSDPKIDKEVRIEEALKKMEELKAEIESIKNEQT